MTERESAAALQESTPEKVEKVFEEDEMRLLNVDPEWTQETLLKQEGIFFLKDVAQHLNVPSADLKRDASRIARNKQDPWAVMGIRKTWTHWQVRMKVFAPYFRNHRLPEIQKVDPEWDANLLLAQSGRFYLTDVCEKVPFTTHQIRYQVRRAADPKNDYGVWKDDRYKAYLVDMPRFAKWMKQIWIQGKFHLGRQKEST